MNIIKQLARLLLGITFMFSGFVKGIDPLGSTYKFTDYFNSFGWEALVVLAFPLGILLAAAEFSIGLALICKLWMKFTAWMALIFMGFFTLLTLYIALKNPVSDCGCFGDAIKLTNWQTFYKNIILIALALLVFKNRKTYALAKGKFFSSGLGAILFLAYCFTVYYSYHHLPLIDFRPYHTGVNIPEAMQTPADAPQDVYETTFEYKNKQTGKIKTFTDKNYPWQDTLNWEYVSTGPSKLIQEGYRPPIHDFMMENENGEDVKDFFLYDKGYTFILVAYNLNKANRKSMSAIHQLFDYTSANNIKLVGMTASVQSDIAQFKAETNTSFDFFNCDEITLKTIIRSNPGLLLIKEGTIIGKWHYNDLPDPSEIKQLIN